MKYINDEDGTESEKYSTNLENECSFEICKIIVVGNVGVGKTSIIRRTCEETFTTNYKSTIGADFFVKQINYNSKSYQLQLWDIGGQERFHSMSRIFYKGATTAIIVFDTSNRKSFMDVLNWKQDIDQKVKYKGKNIPTFLVANKSDLKSTTVEDDEISQVRTRNDFTDWIKTSAKDNIGINELFYNVVGVIDSMGYSCNVYIDNETINSFHIDSKKETNNDKTCCF